MAKKLKEIMQKFTSDEQAEIQAEVDKLIAEEMERQSNYDNQELINVNINQITNT